MLATKINHFDRCAPPRWAAAARCVCLVVGLLLAGCGLNKARLATEQLVVSDAVDRAVADINFSPLSGRTVYFDTKYLAGVKLTPSGNVEYVISSLRQQMAAYDCRLQDKPEDADFIVEARVGVLANDGHEITYGIPGSAAMSTASVFLAAPMIAPAMPELSLGRRNHQQGTAKIGMFAYDRQTREPVWQAGLTKGSSRARDLWVFGLGPFETYGPVKRRGLFARESKSGIGTSHHASDPLSAYNGAVVFQRALDKPAKTEATASLSDRGSTDSAVKTAAHEEPVKDSPLPAQTPPAAAGAK